MARQGGIVRVTLTRRAYMPGGVLGLLELPGIHLGTLELPWEDNHPEESCIPLGIYPMKWWESPVHGWVLRLSNVPHRSDIEIHAANHVTELRGCIAVAMSEHMSYGEPFVMDSQRALRILRDALPVTEEHIIVIVNYTGGVL